VARRHQKTGLLEGNIQAAGYGRQERVGYANSQVQNQSANKDNYPGPS
jgi:hypothetical protein